MSNEINLVGYLKAFEQSEILAMIDPATLQTIKANDSKPYFQAYVAAHEGASTPYAEKIGNIIMNWSKDVIIGLKAKYRTYLKFFDGHNQTVSKQENPVLAYLAGWGTKVINGKLSSLIVAYFPEETRNRAADYNVVSMEAYHQSKVVDKEKGIVNVDRITGVSGFALGRAGKDNPAFAGAKLIGAIQMFTPEEMNEGLFQAFDPNDTNDSRNQFRNNNQNGKEGKNKMSVTLADVKEFIKENGIPPYKVYNSAEIIGSIKIDEKGAVSFEGGDPDITRILSTKFKGVLVPEEKVAEFQKAAKELEEVKPRLAEVEKANKIKLVETEIMKWKEKGLSDEQIEYAKRNLDKFPFSDEIQTGLEKFKVEQMEAYKRDAEFWKKNSEPAQQPRTKVGADNGTASEFF